MKIIPLTEEYARQNGELILNLEQSWQEIGDGVWTLENLLLTMPGKWELSHVAIDEDEFVGYLIGTFHGKKDVYLNKIVVDKQKRNKGYARGLLGSFLDKSLTFGRENIKFKVRTDNPAADFYDRLGFVKRGGLDYSRTDGIPSFFYDTPITEVLPNLKREGYWR